MLNAWAYLSGTTDQSSIHPANWRMNGCQITVKSIALTMANGYDT